MHEELNNHEGAMLGGRMGTLLLFGSLLMLSFLLAIIGALYIGKSVWLIIPMLLWVVFLVPLFRFKRGVFGFWKLVFAFLIYFFVLCALIFIVLPGKSVVGV